MTRKWIFEIVCASSIYLMMTLVNAQSMNITGEDKYKGLYELVAKKKKVFSEFAKLEEWKYLNTLPEKPVSDIISIDNIIWKLETRRQKVVYTDGVAKWSYTFDGKRVVTKEMTIGDSLETYNKDGFFYEYDRGILQDKTKFVDVSHMDYSFIDDSNILLKIRRPLISKETIVKKVSEDVYCLEGRVSFDAFKAWLVDSNAHNSFLLEVVDRSFRKKFIITTDDEFIFTEKLNDLSFFPLNYKCFYDSTNNYFTSATFFSAKGELIGVGKCESMKIEKLK